MERYAEATKQTYEGWDEFYSKPVDEKLDAFKQKGRIFDVKRSCDRRRPIAGPTSASTPSSGR